MAKLTQVTIGFKGNRWIKGGGSVEANIGVVLDAEEGETVESLTAIWLPRCRELVGAEVKGVLAVLASTPAPPP